MSEKIVRRIGWIASSMTVLMFSSYIDQIRLNLQGHPGSVILPAATILNSVSWGLYAILKERVDWPILVCNSWGVLLGSVTLITMI